MNITGLITEYNPFHLGHKLHLNKATSNTCATGTIAIMGGNFVQRGYPALLDKWSRAKIAVLNGVDLVIELPLIYSISSAESFAYGALKILNQTGIVNSLYFGSEAGNIDILKEIAKYLYLENNDYKEELAKNLKLGLPFHSARANSLKNLLQNENINEILSSSNNILGIEYIKALLKLNSSINPYTLKRVGGNYNDSNLKTTIPSATAIRKALGNNYSLDTLKEYMPPATFNELKILKDNKYKFVFPEDTFQYLKYKILIEGKSISKLPLVKEGLDNKIIKEIALSNSLDDLIMRVKSKRYTHTRISRILTSYFIGLENYNLQDIMENSKAYIRPLAFNQNGQKILKEIKNRENIDIITKVKKDTNNEMLKLDILGTKAYSILNSSISPLEDFTRGPYIL